MPWSWLPNIPRSPSNWCPFAVPFLGEGFASRIDCGKKGTLVLASLLEDLECPLAGSIGE